MIIKTLCISMVFIMPCFVGVAALTKVINNHVWQNAMLITGFGYFVGWFIVVFLLYYFPYWLVIMVCLASLIYVICFVVKVKASFFYGQDSYMVMINRMHEYKACICVLIVLTIVRLLNLYIESMFNPLIAWDAWAEYLPKGKVWLDEVLTSENKFNFSIKNDLDNDYRPYSNNFASAVALWMGIAVGEWDESYIFLPWFFSPFFALIALIGILNYYKNSHPFFSLLLIIFVIFSPYVGTHIALPGYLDLFVSSIVGIASGLFAVYEDDKFLSKSQKLILIVLCMVILIALKRKSGVIWAVNIGCCIFFVSVSMRYLLILLVNACLLSITVYIYELEKCIREIFGFYLSWCFGYSDNIVKLLSYSIRLSYDVSNLRFILNSLINYGGWNIFFPIFLMVIISGYKNLLRFRYAVLLLTLFIIQLLIYTLFKYEDVLMNEHGKLTSFNRGVLYVYISAALLIVLVMREKYNSLINIVKKQ